MSLNAEMMAEFDEADELFDDGEEADAVRKIVEQLGHEVIETADGAEVIVQAVGRKPDMIFLDWVMPEKDGLEVLA